MRQWSLALRSGWFLLFFFFSGFASLVYEVVWLRLAVAAFGVTTPIVSIVLSVFMGGLALGSWAAGRLRGRPLANSLRLYAFTELLIASSAVAIPPGLKLGHAIIGKIGSNIEWGSITHHAAAGVCIAAALLPFSAAMGATFPLGMACVRATNATSKRSFSYLYLANVLGATAGTIASAVFLIELLGFHNTLFVAAALNMVVAAGAAGFSVFGSTQRAIGPTTQFSKSDSPKLSSPEAGGWTALLLLFLTGLTSMALEVVWIRQFTPFLGTVVYTFAAILAVYLLATSVGSAIYKALSSWDSGRPNSWMGVIWFAAGSFVLFSLAAADPRLGIAEMPELRWSLIARVALGVAPFCAMAGFLTPSLVDQWSFGNPGRAGSAYALNIVGCIVGPLVTSFMLLPWMGERWSLLVLSVPLLGAGLLSMFSKSFASRLGRWGERAALVTVALLAAVVGCLVGLTRDYASTLPRAIVRRDSTATVIAAGEGMNRKLLVNGFGMTSLNTITKTIAHLPLAFLSRPPRNALVICFGMGTSFRSATTWGIPVTAVELIPSVPDLFGYYHADAAQVVSRPGARVVIDDGRRFLERTRDSYDVITVDPPPPVEAAGSSMLYSREFYALARQRLRAGGILQQWFPTFDARPAAAVARSLSESFPHVRVFVSYKSWGLHFLASDQPIPVVTADELAEKLPAPAAADIVEWELGYIPAGIFAVILEHELSVDQLLARDPNAPALTDDRPINEYYLLHLLGRDHPLFHELSK